MSESVSTIQVPPSYVEAALGTVDEEARTVELVFSTGATFARYDWSTGRRYNLRFSLNRQHVRLNRLNNGAPLLNAHSSYDLSKQVGVVVEKSAAVDGQEARCTVRFSRREEVESIWQDVKDRIIRNVSVGATIHKFEEDSGDGKVPLRTAVDWEPFEVSLVPIGADDGAMVKAAGEVATNPCVVVSHTQEDEMSESQDQQGLLDRFRAHLNSFFEKSGSDEPQPPAQPAPSAAPASADAVTVLQMCREAELTSLAESLIKAEASVEDVKAAIARAEEITKLCEAAEMPELADGYIASALEPKAVGEHLASYAAKADGGEISGHRDPDASASRAPKIDINAIYAERNKAHTASQQGS